MTNVSISVAQVADILGVSRDRIEQSISRKVFLPRAFSDPGKPREWTFDEVMRLAVFFRLTDHGRSMDAKTAGVLTYGGVYGFTDGPAFFVAYSGTPGVWLGTWASSICRAQDITEMLTRGCEYPKILKSGSDAETMAYNSEKLLGPVYACIIVNLDEVAKELKAEWPVANKA
jgi:hypothetical protein